MKASCQLGSYYRASLSSRGGRNQHRPCCRSAANLLHAPLGSMWLLFTLDPKRVNWKLETRRPSANETRVGRIGTCTGSRFTIDTFGIYCIIYYCIYADRFNVAGSRRFTLWVQMSWLKFNLTNIGPAMARPAGPVPTPLGGRDQSKKDQWPLLFGDIIINFYVTLRFTWHLYTLRIMWHVYIYI